MEVFEMILSDWHDAGINNISLVFGFILGMFFTYSIYLFKEPIKGTRKFLGKWIYTYVTKKLKAYK